ncbi:helix-turn-helix domain-containing protein [Clostridium guangxiense]|uniref:helix-turn-helix domain-containing protein n=1 Tax=Clostridium guangxiense TaxID=1662055 RepID=UPI001E5D33BC|nr:helix-turn-helix transcriptional regulator [Clostridium guangxiense]MCD2345795.1 helix-turn-helix domain-containing protein [Clostridium guangxiense]
MFIGRKIHDIRMSTKGMTLKKLSDLTGLAVITISKYESGERTPGRENLKKIADALNESLEYFYGF